MEGGWGSKGVQLVRLRALARDGVRCIVAAWWKKEQGRWNVGCSVGKRRGHLLWARQRARRGRAGEPPTVHQGQCPPPTKKKQPATSRSPCFSNALPHHQQWWQGESVRQESAARGHVTRGARLHRKRRWRGEGTQRVGVAAEMNLWEMLVSADSPTLHRSQGTQTRRASKREEWECEQKKKKELNG